MADFCPFDVTPYAVSTPITNLNIISLNYTNQDFYSMKTRMLDFINQQFSTDFNDFVESSLASMLIEVWAFVADTLSFKIDQIANEIFIDTVTEIDNAFRLCQLVGFQPTPPIAATALFSVSTNTIFTIDVVVPTPLAVSFSANNDTQTIELFPADVNNNPIFNQDIIIPAGQTNNTSVVGVQGQTFTDSFTGTGATNQNYQLTRSPVLWQSIQVAVDGVQWNDVLFFTASQPLREYMVQFDSSYDAFVIFGNSQAGQIPSQGSQIVVSYRVGGGTVGNVVTGGISANIPITVPGQNFVTFVAVQNYTRGIGGYAGDNLQTIQQKLPVYLRTQNRAVTGEDYKTLTDQFATPYNGQIGKSVAALRNYGCAANIIDLYILALDGTDGLMLANDDLKAALVTMLNGVQMFTDVVCLRDGIIVPVDIHIDVTLSRQFRKFQDQIQGQITQFLNAFFALSNWDYGQPLRSSDIIKALSSIQEVENYDITFATNIGQVEANPDVCAPSNSVVTVTFNEIIRQDTVTINFIYV
jgi:hypothetical protein